MENKIRLLKASEIECRVATINDKGISLLLYKDARSDQRILDESFGLFGWRRTHQLIGDSLYCTVEVYDEKKKEWIAKQDVGVPGNAEKEKSAASDSFKRACFNIGVGRELYSSPFIWVPANKTTITKRGDKYYCNDQFKVSSIEYNEDREIVGVTIINQNGVVVYELKPKAHGKLISLTQRKALDKELKRTGVSIDEVLERYKCTEGQITTEIYTKAMNVLKKMETKVA